MRLTSCPVKLIATFGLSLSFAACAPSDTSGGGDVGAAPVSRALYLTGTKWPVNSAGVAAIPVCFDQNVANATNNFANDAIRVRAQATKTWSAAAKIDFTGWGTCGTNRNGSIVVHLVTAVPNNGGDGQFGGTTSLPVGYHGANGFTEMYLHVDDNVTFTDPVDEGAVTHEFGHALGFDHEMNRPDFTITTCSGRSVVFGGSYLDTPTNDTGSIMAARYCSGNQKTELGFWDIWGVRIAYGARYNAFTQLASAKNPSTPDFLTLSAADRIRADFGGYQWWSAEGWAFTKQAPQTVPLQLYWSSSLGDFYTTATAAGINDAIAAGYTFVKTEGYIYPTQQPGTIPLYSMYNSTTHDNLTTSQPGTQMWALANGYGYNRTEGYVFGGYIDPMTHPPSSVGSGSMDVKPYIPALWLATVSNSDNVSLGITDVTFPLFSAAAKLLMSENHVVVKADAAFLAFNVPGTTQAKIYTKNGDYVVAANPQSQSNFVAAGYTAVDDFSNNGGNASPAYLFTSQYDYSDVSNVIPYQLYANGSTNDNFTTATGGGWAKTTPGYSRVSLEGYGFAQDPSPTAFSSSNVFYDGGTQCTVGGITMHCCPDGSAMVGANLGTNNFKCASTSLFGSKVLASQTSSGTSWRCGEVNVSGLIIPTVMVGFHADLDNAACQMSTPLSQARGTVGISEYYDLCTYDSSSMHVCPFVSDSPYTGLMGGINQGASTYLCYNPAHYLPAILSGPLCNPSVAQSSSLEGLDDGPENAVDGNTDGNFWNGSVTHTNNAGDVWWYADVGYGHVITGVKIYNRTDCCSERLSNTYLQHWDESLNNWTTDVFYTDSTLGVSSISFNFQTPFLEYLLIRKNNDPNPLSLAEVQVMGY